MVLVDNRKYVRSREWERSAKKDIVGDTVLEKGTSEATEDLANRG